MVNSYKVYKTAHAALVQNGEKKAHWMSFDRQDRRGYCCQRMSESRGRWRMSSVTRSPCFFLGKRKAVQMRLKEELHALHLRINPDYRELWTETT